MLGKNRVQVSEIGSVVICAELIAWRITITTPSFGREHSRRHASLPVSLRLRLSGVGYWERTQLLGPVET